jgi:hypothetical protein
VVFTNCKTKASYVPPSAGRIGGLALKLSLIADPVDPDDIREENNPGPVEIRDTNTREMQSPRTKCR